LWFKLGWQMWDYRIEAGLEISRNRGEGSDSLFANSWLGVFGRHLYEGWDGAYYEELGNVSLASEVLVGRARCLLVLES
jgi:hypothetical protein